MNSTESESVGRIAPKSEYLYQTVNPEHTDAYLWPVIEKQLRAESRPLRIFDLGCGNGSFMARLEELGFQATGVDPSESGVRLARSVRPEMDIHVGSAYDDLATKYGRFPIVVSLEVVEHVYAPRDYAKTLFELVEPGGIAVISTPYHGYLKNLALAVTGKLDRHFTALWDHGHIKFWSVKTLGQLLSEVGFVDIRFDYAGRTKLLAKSMVAIASRPVELGRNLK